MERAFRGEVRIRSPRNQGLLVTAMGWLKLDKNTGLKCHSFCYSESKCDKTSLCSRLECPIFVWTYITSTFSQNVTVVNCHSRRFIGRMLLLGRNFCVISPWGGRIIRARHGGIPFSKPASKFQPHAMFTEKCWV
jgi:hypothetical protein